MSHEDLSDEDLALAFADQISARLTQRRAANDRLLQENEMLRRQVGSLTTALQNCQWSLTRAETELRVLTGQEVANG